MLIGVLYSRVRVEEKLLFEILEAKGIGYELVDDRDIVFDLWNPEPWRRYDVMLNGSVRR